MQLHNITWTHIVMYVPLYYWKSLRRNQRNTTVDFCIQLKLCRLKRCEVFSGKLKSMFLLSVKFSSKGSCIFHRMQTIDDSLVLICVNMSATAPFIISVVSPSLLFAFIIRCSCTSLLYFFRSKRYRHFPCQLLLYQMKLKMSIFCHRMKLSALALRLN